MATPTIAFFATARSGLGHLQRVGAIARAMRDLRPDLPLKLFCNAPADGMAPDARDAFAEIIVCEKREMAAAAAGQGAATLAVSDMATVPGLERVGERRALILRECPKEKVPPLALAGGLAWDHVLVPNPEEHWRPSPPPRFAAAISAVGWIRRRTGPRRPDEASMGVVLATGGGGTEATRRALYPLLETIVAEARAVAPFRLRQALGPRAGGEALAAADEVFDPGDALHSIFRKADVVISTAGYNSVLELAGCDTPALLLPIPRSFDDQSARVRSWGPRLGHGFRPDGEAAAARWLADQVSRPKRRPPVDLGPDGAAAAARILSDLA